MKVKLEMDHYYALIMAGGSGTRLWPLSRRDRPKQVLPLTEERTMFQLTVERLHNLFAPDHIYVITGAELAGPLRQSAPQLPPENFILEPEGRDSGPARPLRQEQRPDGVRQPAAFPLRAPRLAGGDDDRPRPDIDPPGR